MLNQVKQESSPESIISFSEALRASWVWPWPREDHSSVKSDPLLNWFCKCNLLLSPDRNCLTQFLTITQCEQRLRWGFCSAGDVAITVWLNSLGFSLLIFEVQNLGMLALPSLLSVSHSSFWVLVLQPRRNSIIRQSTSWAVPGGLREPSVKIGVWDVPVLRQINTGTSMMGGLLRWGAETKCCREAGREGPLGGRRALGLCCWRTYSSWLHFIVVCFLPAMRGTSLSTVPLFHNLPHHRLRNHETAFTGNCQTL